MIWHLTFTACWSLDERLRTTCWWLRHMTLLNNNLTTFKHSLCVDDFNTWLSVLINDLPWHSNTHYVLMTHVDDLTSDIHCVLVTWCLLTYYVLMTLTYDTLLYNDSLLIHDLTSWRLTTQRWLDVTLKHPLHVSDLCWWLDIWHSLRVDDSMSGHSLCVDDFNTWLSLLTDDLTWHWTPTKCWWLMLMTWHLTFTVYWWLMTAHSLCVNDFDVWHPAVQWLTAHPWLELLTSHYSTITWVDIETLTAC